MKRRLSAFLAFAFILAFGAGACGQEINVEQQKDDGEQTTVEQQQNKDQPQQQQKQDQPQQNQQQQDQQPQQEQQQQPPQEKEQDGVGAQVDLQ